MADFGRLSIASRRYFLFSWCLVIKIVITLSTYIEIAQIWVCWKGNWISFPTNPALWKSDSICAKSYHVFYQWLPFQIESFHIGTCGPQAPCAPNSPIRFLAMLACHVGCEVADDASNSSMWLSCKQWVPIDAIWKPKLQCNVVWLISLSSGLWLRWNSMRWKAHEVLFHLHRFLHEIGSVNSSIKSSWISSSSNGSSLPKMPTSCVLTPNPLFLSFLQKKSQW